MTLPIWITTPTLEQLNQPTPTLLSHLGMEFIEIGADFLKARMPVDHRTRQPFGLLHGGASVALAETMGSFGAHLTIDTEKFAAVGLEINANHVRSVRSGWVIGTARPLHRGKSTQLWEIHITDEAEKLVCVSRFTVALVAKTQAA
jgi:1,4-dihydroxy-2-naphthoyl-CoA hydrolase